MSDDKTPIEHAVELAVLAPIGFALEAKRLLPTFVERGRQQVNMARVVGQFAVTHGQTTASKKLTQVQAQAESILAEFGLAGTEPDATVDEAEPTASADSPAAPVTPPAPRSSAAAAELPIADYDSLAASQVIPRLAGLSAPELAAVEAYELSHRGRKTILGKITQLGAE
ncbi:hypothetical protein ACE2AJ_01890 [Aquihabitans daechungensis]|uniref:hypothetical protein n=1 Tax=Aquihabitans daechungensis TaxID=1052257 RepID=UPI003BA180F4